MIVRVIALIFFLLSIDITAQQVIMLQGEVVESTGNYPLKGVKVILMDSLYNKLDSAMSGQNMFMWDNQTAAVQPATFNLKLPARKGKYWINASIEGYDPVMKAMNITKIGSRESMRDIERIVMNKSPLALNAVTVQASRIKFYNKGDTLVYNADAFDLPEGSMLSALIAQLPGVELKDNGQIFVNGKFVESLLLDGKDFFSKNNSIMLENLGSYLVKDITVYEKAGKLSDFLGKNIGDSEYVMDVRLKKEYQTGLLGNVEGGYGTDERYLGRLFGLLYTSNLRLGLFGGTNNLNDNQMPGEYNSSKPDYQMQGTRVTRNAGLQYNISSGDKKFEGEGRVYYNNGITDSRNETNRINFLPSGNNYQYSFTNNRFEQHSLSFFSRNGFNRTKSRLTFSVYFDYNHSRDDIDGTSLTTEKEVTDISKEYIRDLYQFPASSFLNEVINRSLTSSLSRSNRYNGSIYINEMIKIPYTTDVLQFSATAGVKGYNQRTENGYIVNSGSSADPFINEILWGDSRPKTGWYTKIEARYTYLNPGVLVLDPTYTFSFDRNFKGNEVMTVDNWTGAEQPGLYPWGDAVYSPTDSYESQNDELRHSLSLKFSKSKINGTVGVDFVKNNIIYRRGGEIYDVSRFSVIPVVKDLMYTRRFGKVRRGSYGGFGEKHQLQLIYNLSGVTPTMEWLVPITDDTNPLYIIKGADKLKNQLNNDIKLRWLLHTDYTRKLNHTLDAGYTFIINSLTRKVVYDSNTGVRTLTPANINGNDIKYLTSILSLQFGRRNQFTIANNGSLRWINSNDMLGTQNIETEKSRVNSSIIADNFRFDWQIGKHKLGFIADLNWQMTEASKNIWADLEALTLGFGVNALLRLPYNWNLSTDLTYWRRNGFELPGSNKNSVLWNLKITYTPAQSGWTLIAEGYDMLHQFNNITYNVDAQSRTVTLSNTIPRYFIFHAIYRFNIKPKSQRK